MNEQQRLFLVQARSDRRAFGLLENADACHRLHYLQMMSEKLTKAYFWRYGFPGKSHGGLVSFLQAVAKSEKAGAALGHPRKAVWKSKVLSVLDVAKRLEDSAPALAGDGPNPEYPWPSALPTTAPAEFHFPIWREFRQEPAGRRLLGLLDDLLANAEQYF